MSSHEPTMLTNRLVQRLAAFLSPACQVAAVATEKRSTTGLKSPPPEIEEHHWAPGRFHLNQAGFGIGSRDRDGGGEARGQGGSQGGTKHSTTMQDDYKKNYGNSGKRIINPKNVIELFRDKKEEKKDKAAHVIQKTWRRWLDMGVFEYYKELIGFKQYGEPCHLMKYIEPREAEFLDAAAGVHIKFRLGGEKFPPSIYYKIFTHRPIVDLCANSPKDYAKMATQPNPRKLQKGSVNESTSDWYQRIENNGWRLLSIRRKRNMVKRRKARKIEWLKKMYFGENLQVKTENPEAIVLIQRATEGLIKSLEKEGIDQVMEWEVDEMLKWTNALNYDEYVKLWKEVGTSKTSESFQAFRFTQQDNIYELIPNKFQEIMQSHLKKKK
ncbi:putative protein C11orf65 like [Crotalus adamanteus]|uniref:Uncharacterized protein n=1 Tax=Crotalus adamanteus TaxID=8729 RepID=A0AAW1BK47_CROAD